MSHRPVCSNWTVPRNPASSALVSRTPAFSRSDAAEANSKACVNLATYLLSLPHGWSSVANSYGPQSTQHTGPTPPKKIPRGSSVPCFWGPDTSLHMNPLDWLGIASSAHATGLDQVAKVLNGWAAGGQTPSFGLETAAQEQQPGRNIQTSKGLPLALGRLEVRQVVPVAEETVDTVRALPACEVDAGPTAEQGMSNAPGYCLRGLALCCLLFSERLLVVVCGVGARCRGLLGWGREHAHGRQGLKIGGAQQQAGRVLVLGALFGSLQTQLPSRTWLPLQSQHPLQPISQAVLQQGLLS